MAYCLRHFNDTEDIPMLDTVEWASVSKLLSSKGGPSLHSPTHYAQS